MRKDNAIFFAGGLVFGLLLGYFVFATVSQSPGGFSAGGLGATSMGTAPSPQGQSAMTRRVLDPQEESALKNMIQQNPDDNESRIRLGNLYLESGHDDQAIPLFREVLEKEPGNNHARLHLAQTLADMGRLDESVSEYQTILTNEPANPAALLGLGRVRLYAQQDINGGLEAWNELMRVAPNSQEAQSIRDELEALKSAHAMN